MDDGCVDIDVVAKVCDVLPETVLSWIRSGKLEAVVMETGRYGVPQGVLDAMYHPARPPELVGLSGVYFIGCREFVKIGLSNDVHRRMKEIQDGMPPFDVELLHVVQCPATAAGATRLERAFHQQFQSLRYRREWFHRTPEIEAFIERLKATRVTVSGS